MTSELPSSPTSAVPAYEAISPPITKAGSNTASVSARPRAGFGGPDRPESSWNARANPEPYAVAGHRADAIDTRPSAVPEFATWFKALPAPNPGGAARCSSWASWRTRSSPTIRLITQSTVIVRGAKETTA